MRIIAIADIVTGNENTNDVLDSMINIIYTYNVVNNISGMTHLLCPSSLRITIKSMMSK
jgi:hypothetical protein